MKKTLFLFVCLLGMMIPCHAQQTSSFPQGPISISPWTGKLSVGGVTIEKELWDRYFSPEDLADFRSGKIMNDVGGIVATVGAIPFGYGLGYVLGWRAGGGPTDHPSYQTAKTCLWVGLGVMVAGLAVGIPGSVKMNRAVKHYNTSLTYQPELRWGNTENGFGLAFAF